MGALCHLPCADVVQKNIDTYKDLFLKTVSQVTGGICSDGTAVSTHLCKYLLQASCLERSLEKYFGPCEGPGGGGGGPASTRYT